MLKKGGVRISSATTGGSDALSHAFERDRSSIKGIQTEYEEKRYANLTFATPSNPTLYR